MKFKLVLVDAVLIWIATKLAIASFHTPHPCENAAFYIQFFKKNLFVKSWKLRHRGASDTQSRRCKTPDNDGHL